MVRFFTATNPPKRLVTFLISRIPIRPFLLFGAAFAGLAGSLFGHFTMYLHPNSFLFITSFYVIIMIVVGGLGSIEGAIVGAVLVTVLLEVFREFGAFRLVNFAALLILIMIYRPQGLLGHWKMPRIRSRAAVAK